MHAFCWHPFGEGGGGVAALDRIETQPQLAELRVIEPGPDAAGIAQPARPVVTAENERAEAVPGAARFGEADYHELVAAVAFDLAPIGPAPRPIGPVAALGDRAFEAIAAGMAEEIGAVPLLMVA